MSNQYVVLVDSEDKVTGTMEKMEAHQKGCLHRAFSIFVFNSQHELLLQKRASVKYHSGGLWTNTCCSHPKADTLLHDIHERLLEEMGFDCELEKAFTFQYYAELDKGLIEHEYDHVFIGHFDGVPQINPEEVEAYQYISIPALEKWLAEEPEAFTEWFKIVFERVVTHVRRDKKA